MLKVGLTGGIGSGKSFVAAELARLGCQVICADELGHQVLAPDGEAYHPAVARFGTAILDEDGFINRKRLAADVFSAPERLALLNSIVHPAVRRREESLTAELAGDDPDAIVIVEAAILIESGMSERFDRMILVFCEEAQQIERAMARNGMNRDDVVARISRQMPLADKRRFADFCIDTSGAKEETLRQTRHIHTALRSIRK